jgi:hypothetical protein
MKKSISNTGNIPKSKINTSIAILLCLVILLQRTAINISDYQFSIGMIFFFIFMLFWFIRKEIRIIPQRLTFFLVAFVALIFSALVSHTYSKYFSFASLGLLIGLYFWSIFAFKKNGHLVALGYFRTIMLVFSIVGILQFLTQLLGIPYRDWLSFIPREYILRDYNYNIPISFSSSLYKSNGIVFLEPSFYSQMISLAIIIEVYRYKKYWHLIFLLPALLLSFSGTGLILLAVGLLPFIFSLKVRRIFLFGIISLTFLILFFVSGFWSYTSNRISEFQRPGTSGYIRFISPVVNYVDFITEPGKTIEHLFGLGPGGSEEYQWNVVTYPNVFMKLLVEYGIAGFIFLLYLVFIFFSKRPFWLSLSVFLMFSILAGTLLVPQIVVIYYLLLLL